MLGNPSFETNDTGTPDNVSITAGLAVGDEWRYAEATNTAGFYTGFDVHLEALTPQIHSGQRSLLISVPRSAAISSNHAARVYSTMMNILPGAQLSYGGWMSCNANVVVPPGANILQRMGLRFYDAAGTTFISETFRDIITPAGSTAASPWAFFDNTVVAPFNAGRVVFQCALFNTFAAAFTTGPNDAVADCRFDDMFIYQQYQTSTFLRPQGSILPYQSIGINWSATNHSVTFSWAAQSILRSDGSSVSVPAGSQAFPSLSASTTYYTYWRADVNSGVLSFTNSNPPPSSPNALAAAQMAADGFLAISPIVVTTLAASNPGTGTGVGGGAGTCPESAELVDVEGKGQITAGQVQPGDRIKGRSLQTNEDVYRPVVQVTTQSCAAWRMVGGHRVSPCEPVYVDGKWMPAFMAPGSTFDSFDGVKILISVASDQYDEQNYYLVSGEPLLIHNTQVLPC
jgi:hypothetical protein